MLIDDALPLGFEDHRDAEADFEGEGRPSHFESPGGLLLQGRTSTPL